MLELHFRYDLFESNIWISPGLSRCGTVHNPGAKRCRIAVRSSFLNAMSCAESFYWKPALCLQPERGLSVRLLRRHGVDAKVVIGFPTGALREPCVGGNRRSNRQRFLNLSKTVRVWYWIDFELRNHTQEKINEKRIRNTSLKSGGQDRGRHPRHPHTRSLSRREP